MVKNELNYLFVTGMGRSGTTFLADLLSKIPEVSSGHERIGNREYWLLSWYLGSNYSRPYLEREKKRIDEQHKGSKYYVDVNSYLQNSTQELKSVFETQNVLHILRDPKEVVRSIYTRRNDMDVHLVPKSEQEVRQWLEADRFIQVCTNWKLTMDQLMTNNIPIIRFEQLTTEYDYVRSKLLDPFQLELSQKEWERAKSIRTNKTPGKAYRFMYAKAKGKQFQSDELGKFDTWPREFQSTFEKICSKTATKLGY